MQPAVAWCEEGKGLEMIHVLIADDHRLVRDGFRAVLEREKDLQVVGEARDGKEAIELARRLKPDIVVMDIQMPRLNGLEATRELHSVDGNKILIVSMLRDESLVRQALSHGAQGYITKDESFTELINAIRAIHEGKTYFSRSICEILGKLT